MDGGRSSTKVPSCVTANWSALPAFPGPAADPVAAPPRASWSALADTAATAAAAAAEKLLPEPVMLWPELSTLEARMELRVMLRLRWGRPSSTLTREECRRYGKTKGGGGGRGEDSGLSIEWGG